MGMGRYLIYCCLPFTEILKFRKKLFSYSELWTKDKEVLQPSNYIINYNIFTHKFVTVVIATTAVFLSALPNLEYDLD